MENTYICSHCGFINETSEVDHTADGFWCDNCDSFNYYIKSKDLRKYEVLLESNTGMNPNTSRLNIKLKKRVSPLRYPGGKTRLIELVYSLLDTNKKTLIEPYCGGSSIGLSLLLSGVIDQLIINDIDIGIYTLFKTITNNPGELIGRLHRITPTKELFLKYKKMIANNYQNYSSIDIAFGYLVVNRCAYSGIYNAGALSDISSRWNTEGLIKRIEAIHEKKDSITILNMDALELIEEMFWNENTTIFIDPPYYQKGKQLYNHYYTEVDHENLSLLLNSLVSGMPSIADIIVTYDKCDEIDQLYKYFANIKVIDRNYSIYK